MEQKNNKPISARKIIAVTVVSTYCAIMLGTVILTIMKLLSVPVFLGIFSGFSTLVLAISNAYFQRKDRINGGKDV